MSDSHTLPAASPLSFVAVGDYENAAFGVNPTGLNSAATGLPCSPASQLMPPPPPPLLSEWAEDLFRELCVFSEFEVEFSVTCLVTTMKHNVIYARGLVVRAS